MITENRTPAADAMLEEAKKLTHSDLLAMPNVQHLAAILGVICSQYHPGTVHMAMALIMGSVAFDAEMQTKLAANTTPDQQAVTFEDRLALFEVHATAGYEGVKAFCQAEKPYGSGH